MNIFLVGNGFDLAHGLPTDYMSFVKFLNIVQIGVTWGENHNAIREDMKQFQICPEFDSFFLDYFSSLPNDRNIYIEEVQDLMQDNFWTTYFLPAANRKNTWINFESEISRIIQALDRYINTTDKSERLDKLSLIAPIFGRVNITKDEITRKGFEKLRDRLLADLDNLIRCLEIYLCLCLEIVPVNKQLSSVAQIGYVDKVLSFNYTNTFEKTYFLPHKETYLISYGKFPEYCYIHGRAHKNSSGSNNMVLGIDEYLSEPERSKNVEFLHFKKFYQRIFKQTDYNFVDWLKGPGEKRLYIIGHSLDKTDGDVLRDMLTSPHMETTIYYHTKDANAQQISNLLNILGYDELNALTRGQKDSSITFKLLG